jgi:peptidoglycan/xylan/chitin deacetylase (PgdA/CDA1 family)
MPEHDYLNLLILSINFTLRGHKSFQKRYLRPMKKLILLITLILVSQHAEAHSDQHKDLREGNIERVYPGQRKVILTFDDGPTQKATPQILETLKQYNIKATFFVLGKLAKQNPSLMSRIEKEGHIVANHSYEHKNIGDFSRWSLKKKLKKSFFAAHEELVPYTSNADHWFFRAPYGSWQKKASKVINETEIGKDYIGPVLWDIGGNIRKDESGVYQEAADWGCWSKGLSIDQCLEGYLNRTDKRNGGVILMHDIHTKSATMLVRLIPELLKRGYTFMNLDEVGLTK